MLYRNSALFALTATLIIAGSTSATQAASVINAYLPTPYNPRIEKIHVTVSTVNDNSMFAVSIDSDFQYTQVIHHDGDPITVSNSAVSTVSNHDTYLSVSISVDPNSNGSYPKNYLITSDADGSIKAQNPCAYGYSYCSTGITSEAFNGQTAWGIPSGSYTLLVTYWDGTWARHSMVLNGLAAYAQGRFGAVQMSAPTQF